MRYIFTILSILFLTSCGSYSIITRQPDISHVVAITTEGDTVKVPIQALQRDLTPDYYSGYRFYWNNSWWLYNDWYWNYWYRNPQWFYPRYRIETPKPRVSTPRYRYTPPRFTNTPNTNRRQDSRVQPQTRTPKVQPNRGRSNQQPRTPQYNRPTRSSTPHKTESKLGAVQSSTRSNSQSRTTSDGKVIKQ